MLASVMKNKEKDKDREKDREDYSITDLSKVTIRNWDAYSLERDIKKIKYPTYSISNAEDLEAKIESFKDENIRTELKAHLAHLNSLRKVRGDGNCFFRALAFCYLAEAIEPSVKSCFGLLNSISLTCCYPESIPADFKPFYEHNFLKNMLIREWQPLYSKLLQESKQNSRKALIKVFDEYPFLDFIVVLYFRAICLKGLWKYEEELKEFLLGKEQEYIRTYSEETEGVSINICSMMLKLVIKVYEIRKGVVKVYLYDNVDKKKGEIHLLFYENHYDILEQNEQIAAEQNSLSKKSNFYSDVSRKTVRGTCLECGQERQVYEDSTICYFCFDKIEQVAKQYDGERLIRARCQDCQWMKSDVVEAVGLCKSCIRYQNQAEERRKEREKNKAERDRGNDKDKDEKEKEKDDMEKDKDKNDKDKEVKPERDKIDKDEKPKEDKQSPVKPSRDVPSQKPKTVMQKCVLCNFLQKVDSETGICDICTTSQKKMMNRVENQKTEQKRRESTQKPRAGLKLESRPVQPIDEYYNRFKLKQQVIEDPQVCERCKQSKLLEDKTKLCVKCYREVFSSLGYCSGCKFKQYLHDDLRKCKLCLYLAQSMKEKGVTGSQRKPAETRKYCIKCQMRYGEKQGMCELCYKSSYCQSCKKSSLTSVLIYGRCPACRK